jgi:hypothetical protein
MSKKPATRTKQPAVEVEEAAAERPKALVFAIDEIPHVAAMADAFRVPPAVRRSPLYFHPEDLDDQVKLPPDRVCTDEEEVVGHAFLTRLAVDFGGRTWEPAVYPEEHTRAWHDVPVDELAAAFEACGFDVVRAPEVMAASGLAREAAVAAKLRSRRFADPSSDLFFTDAFGLTRVAADGRISTDPELWGSGLWIDADGRLGLLLRETQRVGFVIGLAQATQLGALERGALMRPAMHPAGGALVLYSGEVGLRARPLNANGKPSGELTRNLYVETAPPRKPLRLGGNSIHLVCDQALVFDADGNYLAWLDEEWDADFSDKPRSLLCGGRFADLGGPATVAWRADLRGPRRARLSLSIADGIPVVCVREMAKSKVHVAVLGEDAARVRTVESLIAPVRVGQTLVYQPDAGTVVREPLTGEGASRYPLAGRSVGRGRVVARGERWLFVPGHGESVIDLESGRELDRRLPATDASARAKALDLLAKVTALVADAGMEADLTKLDTESSSCELRLWGGGPVLGQALIEALRNPEYAASAGAGSLSISGDPERIGHPVTRDELVELLHLFARHEMKLAWAEFFLGHLCTPSERAEIEPDAEALLLWALLDEVGPTPGSFEAKLAGWTKEAATLERIGERLAAVEDRLAQQYALFQEAIVYMTIHLFGSEALDLWLAIPAPRLRFLDPGHPLAWLAKHDARARERLARWLETIDRPAVEWEPIVEAVRGNDVADEDEDGDDDDDDDEEDGDAQ